jgi:hypothetical protein
MGKALDFGEKVKHQIYSKELPLLNPANGCHYTLVKQPLLLD